MSEIQINLNVENLSADISKGYFEQYNDSFENEVTIIGRKSELNLFRKKINKKINIFEEIENIFQLISGTITVIIKNKDFIKIVTSIYHPTLRVFKNNKNLIFTEKEFLDKNSLSQNLSLLKMLSHHSFFFHKGLSSSAIDFVTPGSTILIKKNSEVYENNWYLKFNEFCSNNDPEENANDFSSILVETMGEYAGNNNYISLSGGVDSALTLAAAVKANLNIQTVHLSNPIFDDETSTALNVSKFFNKKVNIINNYTGSHLSVFNFKTDLNDYLKFAYQETARDSVTFPLDNSGILLKKKFLNEKICLHDGNSFPTALTIKHWFNYPNRKNKKFIYNQNSNLRYYDSEQFLKEKLNDINQKDTWGLGIKFPEINPFYWPILDCFYTGGNFHSYRPENYLKNFFPLLDDSNSNKKIFDLLKNKGNFLVEKIIKSNFFSEKLKTKDATTAAILLKFVVFINASCKAMHQNFVLCDDNFIKNTPGLNGKSIMKLLSIKIDNQLINNAKWHIFRSFEILSNKKFEELFYYQSLLNPKFVTKRVYQKLIKKVYGLMEFDEVYTYINNKTLHNFIIKNKIFEKYNDIRSFNKDLPNIPSFESLKNKKNIKRNYWLLNNILNLTSRL